jgi:PD-(D/E)XK endonuclease
MTTDQKGAIAERAIQLAATRLGIDVYRPVAEGGRYDMIFDLDEGL